MHKVIVIGGGAAGLFAAYASANAGNEVILIEKNEKLGKKMYITGKGRCNLTNEVSPEDFLKNVVTNPKFLFSSIYSFSPEKTMEFFENSGLKLKTERGNRVFPLSDKASDVTKTLERKCLSAGVKIILNTEVRSLNISDGKIHGVVTDSERLNSDSVIVCTGGVSYPLTGSTGDGYVFAENAGHTVTEPKPSLVGIEIKGDFCKKLQGLSLKNVNLTAKSGEKILFSEMGEMLFTHFGISGPIVLSCSCNINKISPNKVDLFLDFKPALTRDDLERRFLREFKENNLKTVFSVMCSALPKAVIPFVLAAAGVSESKKCSEITLTERKNIINTLKSFNMKINSLRPIEEAIVTSGGVNVKEINPKTMESKLVKGLFFAGEVLDVDAYTGGFNMQTAFSTGFAAGVNS